MLICRDHCSDEVFLGAQSGKIEQRRCANPMTAFDGGEVRLAVDSSFKRFDGVGASREDRTERN